ncbi:hypothetical protein HIM_00686 [Hirsutella minnesotensis 3608]|nr:hypothetical protein HIM_00686 [Hirsutella minnesotensis 3608]
MDTAILRGLVEVQSHPSERPRIQDAPLPPPITPDKAIHRTYPGAPQRPESIELPRTLSRVGSDSGPGTPHSFSDDVEMSRPATPSPESEGVEAMASVWHPFMNRFRLLAVCLSNFGNALNDGAIGALIPYMEKFYGISYGTVSLIFVGQAVGFVVAAIVLDVLRAKLGRAKVLGLGQALMTLAYIPLIAAAPFGVVVASFFFIGFGIALNVAMGNTFCGVLRNGTFMLGLLHGSYGIGGTSGPLIATALVSVAGALWTRYYLLTLGIGVVTLILSVWSFWRFEKEQSPSTRERETRQDAGSLMRGMLMALKLRVVLLGAVFTFAYQGAEVSISGWVISFLIQARGGDPSSVGYVSAGFWAGITLGRFVLSVPAQRIGEKSFVYALIVGAGAFQMLVWWVPNIVGDAVAVSIVGLFLGPVYPCAAAVFMRALSSRDVLTGMGSISACGSLGGAVAPFITGLVAQAAGTYVLHPIVIALYAVMMLCWYCIPTPAKKSE